MLKRNLGALVLTFGALLVSQTRAQQEAFQIPELSPEDLAFAQQMQEFGQQMFQNMQTAGIDPQELFAPMVQQLQEGTLDPEAIQQMMIDKGIITPQMMTQMQGSVRTYGYSSIRKQLNATDEEWAVLQAKIQRIALAQADVNLNASVTTGGGGLGRGLLGGGALAPQGAGNSDSEAAKAFKALKAVLKEQNAPDQSIVAKLKAWHEAHAKAKAELASAQEDLLKVVTLRQEAILLRIGLL